MKDVGEVNLSLSQKAEDFVKAMSEADVLKVFLKISVLPEWRVVVRGERDKAAINEIKASFIDNGIRVGGPIMSDDEAFRVFAQELDARMNH